MTQPRGHRVSFDEYDFSDLLHDDAAWQNAKSHVSVLSIAMHTIEHYEDLESIIAMTRRNSFQIATAGGVVYTDGLCERQGMEGMPNSHLYAREIVAAVKRWKTYGGRLDYIILDSPFFFGYYRSSADCGYSIAEVARRAASTYHEIAKIYPDVKIMDAEGPGPVPVAKWLPELAEWLSDFKQAAGHPIDAVGLDWHWDDAWHTGYEWVSAAKATVTLLHSLGVSAGLYIKAKDKDVASDHDWLALNRSIMGTAARSDLKLDFVYIVSWMKFPHRNLPETDPDAYTSLINDAYDDFDLRK